MEIDLIETQWIDLVRHCYPGLDPNTVQYKTMRYLFYAGHASMCALLQVNKNVEQILDKIESELKDNNRNG